MYNRKLIHRHGDLTLQMNEAMAAFRENNSRRDAMDPAIPTQEGFVPFHGYKVWYRIVGGREKPGKLPLLCLHGGPGGTHDYLESLEAAAASGRRVIFYDQLGCGNSDQPHNPSMWTVDLFVEEVGVMRRALGLDRVHLLGQSWGGMLGMEYALTQPTGLASLVVADSPASMLQWVSEANRLRADLPPDVQRTLLKHEAAGTVDTPEYQEAVLVFYRRHVCRLDPWPDFVNRSFEKLDKNPEVYRTMNGPSEFFVTGTLKEWDIVSRLGEIRVPTLVIGGRYDEATPAITGTVHRGIPGSEWVLFENSSHMPHVEETERYLRVLDNFLNRVETPSGH
jgi:L-proline amide hydrolase